LFQQEGWVKNSPCTKEKWKALVDTLSIIELQGDLARTNIYNARSAFKRLFSHFFPKQT
jgi:predicted phosphohydrolase